jgi:ribonuclease HII
MLTGDMLTGDALTGDAPVARLPLGSFRVGVDENGLGARLGPLVVTAVLADVNAAGQALMARLPRGKIREDLGDSKRLVSHADVTLGEAWARVLTGDRWPSPRALFEHLSIESPDSLQKDCPSHIGQQCWGIDGEGFESSGELRARIGGHVAKLRQRGVDVQKVLVASTCTQRLNRAKESGRNRFVSDLHAMEALLLDLREKSGRDIVAVCGKVGGMTDYDRFFGPLSGRLRSTLVISRKRSGYYFPGLGEVHFVQDADARDPLVMLASLVGKYVRELLMARISRFHAGDGGERVSGYHDPRTSAWVKATQSRRRSLRIVDDCFERARDTAT